MECNGEKSELPKDFKQGDFVKLFGQIRTSIDDNGKEHSNVRIFSSKLLKAKEQMKGQEEKKESVLGAIKKYQAEDKEKPKESKVHFRMRILMSIFISHTEYPKVFSSLIGVDMRSTMDMDTQIDLLYVPCSILDTF